MRSLGRNGSHAVGRVRRDPDAPATLQSRPHPKERAILCGPSRAGYHRCRLVAWREDEGIKTRNATHRSLRSGIPGDLQCKSTAFTLVELLVTISVVGMLTALLVPAILTARGQASSTACLTNLKMFALAFQLYADDHQDSVLPNRDGEQIPLGETWVEGWLGMPGPDCTNTLYLKRSLIGSYIADTKLWQCPRSGLRGLGMGTMPRVRTVSLNCFMGSPVRVSHAKTYRRTSDITAPSPSDALVFFEERIDTINDASFGMEWSFDANNKPSWVLRDKPAASHLGGANLTYADGHVALHRWQDARTRNPPRNDADMPGNQDVLWMQQHGTWREKPGSDNAK